MLKSAWGRTSEETAREQSTAPSRVSSEVIVSEEQDQWWEEEDDESPDEEVEICRWRLFI